VVRAVYPDIWCVDVEPQAGGLLRYVQVYGDVLPHVHADRQRPSYVTLWHRGGEMQDVWCRPVTWRQFHGPEKSGEEEKRYYHKHLQIERVGDITIRITPDNRIYLFDAETGDYCLYESETRTFHVIAPHIFLGSDEEDRIEYHQEDEVRVVIPKCLVGATAIQDADGITYLANTMIHLVSSLIKLTASDAIILDPPQIKLGNANASEQLLLGNAWMTFFNTFITLFNAHQHTNVQNGGGVSGAPSTATPAMTNALLSDIARVSKTGL
jgi:hypothetical protein